MSEPSFFNSDAMQQIPREKVAQLRALADSLQGNSMQENMQIITTYMQTQKNDGGLSQEEQSIILEAMKASLSPEQRAKFELMAQFIKRKSG